MALMSSETIQYKKTTEHTTTITLKINTSRKMTGLCLKGKESSLQISPVLKESIISTRYLIPKTTASISKGGMKIPTAKTG